MTYGARKIGPTPALGARGRAFTDAYIDRLVAKDIFEQRKTALLAERKTSETLAGWEGGSRNVADELLEVLERANTA